ncbi:hypothetical protein HRH25_12890 [Flavisolibacter sp. BT320]|nr:hypothetical protein [Flavisolibacter longurius]
MRLKQSPYHLLILAGLSLVLTGFLLDRDRTIDIHLHDTFFVISEGYIYYLLAFFVWILWCLYLVTSRVLYSKHLTWMHVLITLLTILILLILLNFRGSSFSASSNRYLDLSYWHAINEYSQGMRWMVYNLIVLLMGQLLLFVNVIIGIIKQIRY